MTIKELDTYTSSSIDCFKTCARKYQLKYEQQWDHDGEEAHPLFFGKLAHAVSESFVGGGELGEFVEGGQEALDAADPFDIVRAEVLGEFAFKLIESEVDVIVESEGHISVDFGLYRFNGRYDLIVRINGYLWVVDYKFTTGLKPREYWLNLSQGDNYINGVRSEFPNEEVRGVIWVNINKPSTKPILIKELDADGKEFKRPKLDEDENPVLTKTGKPSMEAAKRREYPGEYAERLEKLIYDEPTKYGSVVAVKRSAKDINDTILENEYYIDRISDLKNTWGPIWPRNTGACEKFNKMCEFCNICNISNEDTIQGSGYIKRAHKHAELANEEEAF